MANVGLASSYAIHEIASGRINWPFYNVHHSLFRIERTKGNLQTSQQFGPGQRFCQCVSGHFVRRTVGNFHFPSVDEMPNIVILDINMLRPLVTFRVLNQGQSALIIAEYLYGLSRAFREVFTLSKFNEQFPEPDSLLGAGTKSDIFSLNCRG